MFLWTSASPLIFGVKSKVFEPDCPIFVAIIKSPLLSLYQTVNPFGTSSNIIFPNFSEASLNVPEVISSLTGFAKVVLPTITAVSSIPVAVTTDAFNTTSITGVTFMLVLPVETNVTLLPVSLFWTLTSKSTLPTPWRS